MIYVFTSCALNFFPSAKALMKSVKQHIPDVHTVVTVIDATPPELDQHKGEYIDEILSIEDLDIPVEHLDRWIFRHNVMELSTAVKPFTFQCLFKRGDCDLVLFYDCDCILFQPQKTILELLETYSIVLTPHANLPHTNEAWIFFERNPLKVGVYNLGFLGVRNNDVGDRLMAWWALRLRDYCLMEVENGLFTDQKWMDFIPCYFDDYEVSRSPALNVARWNTFQRKLSRAEDGTLMVDDVFPVEFIHFSGFSKVGGYVQGLYDRHTERFVQNIDLLDELTQWYANMIRPDLERPLFQREWQYGFYADGEPIPDLHRKLYREDHRFMHDYPDPFQSFRPVAQEALAASSDADENTKKLIQHWKQRAERAEASLINNRFLLKTLMKNIIKKLRGEKR